MRRQAGQRRASPAFDRSHEPVDSEFEVGGAHPVAAESDGGDFFAAAKTARLGVIIRDRGVHRHLPVPAPARCGPVILCREARSVQNREAPSVQNEVWPSPNPGGRRSRVRGCCLSSDLVISCTVMRGAVRLRASREHAMSTGRRTARSRRPWPHTDSVCALVGTTGARVARRHRRAAGPASAVRPSRRRPYVHRDCERLRHRGVPHAAPAALGARRPRRTASRLGSRL